MDIMEAMEKRHSVRSYTTEPISSEIITKLQDAITECNKESGLNIQLALNDKKVFIKLLSLFGLFANACNYICLVGPTDEKFDELLGYYGEKLVLLAQQLGLNSCWVGGTAFKGKAACTINTNEKIRGLIVIGHGADQGKPHKSKKIEQVAPGTHEEWFIKGVEAALLAPTAVNQQKFQFSEKGGQVVATAGKGSFAKLDLGIVKYHFELGAGRKITWAE